MTKIPQGKTSGDTTSKATRALSRVYAQLGLAFLIKVLTVVEMGGGVSLIWDPNLSLR